MCNSEQGSREEWQSPACSACARLSAHLVRLFRGYKQRFCVGDCLLIHGRPPRRRNAQFIHLAQQCHRLHRRTVLRAQHQFTWTVPQEQYLSAPCLENARAMSQLSDLLLISGFLPSQVTRIADAASQGRINMKMLVSDPAILGNLLYAKGFPLRRRRSSDNPATVSLHNLAALDSQSHPSFSILNRTKIARLSPPLGRVHSLRPSNTLRQQPRNIERWCSLNLGKHEISVAMYGYCIPTARRAPRCCLTSLTIKKREVPKHPNSDIQMSLARSKNAHASKHFSNPRTPTPLVREIKWKK